MEQVPRKSNGGQVADSRLLWTGVLDDLSAEVAAFYGTKVLLIGLAIASVLVQHVWVACLHLHHQQNTCQLLMALPTLPASCRELVSLAAHLGASSHSVSLCLTKSAASH